MSPCSVASTPARTPACGATFDLVPDAPVTSFTLKLAGGKKGLLQNSKSLCAHAYRATVKMDAHNGKTHDFSPKLKVACGKKGKKRGKGKHRRGAS